MHHFSVKIIIFLNVIIIFQSKIPIFNRKSPEMRLSARGRRDTTCRARDADLKSKNTMTLHRSSSETRWFFHRFSVVFQWFYIDFLSFFNDFTLKFDWNLVIKDRDLWLWLIYDYISRHRDPFGQSMRYTLYSLQNPSFLESGILHF